MNEWNVESVQYLAVLLLGMACSAAVALWYWHRRDINLMPMLAKVVFGSLLMARIAFILQHPDTYGTDLATIFDLADRGYTAMPGLFAALVIGA